MQEGASITSLVPRPFENTAWYTLFATIFRKSQENNAVHVARCPRFHGNNTHV